MGMGMSIDRWITPLFNIFKSLLRGGSIFDDFGTYKGSIGNKGSGALLSSNHYRNLLID